MATAIAIIGVCLTALLGSITLIFVIRADHREVAARDATRIAEAEARGRERALVDARLAELEQREQQRQEGAQQ